MNNRTQMPAKPAAPGGGKTVWAAALVLVVVVLAMGAALIRIQSHPVEPRMVVLPKAGHTAATQTMPSVAGAPIAAQLDTSAVAVPASLPAAVPSASKNQGENRPQTPTNQAQAAIDTGANQAIEITAKPRPVSPRQPEPAVLQPPAMGTSHSANPEQLHALPR